MGKYELSKILKAFALTFILMLCASSALAENIVYPDDVFATNRNGRGILNVKTLFGAKGDGVTDDTAAIVAAYNAAINTDYKIIYFPNGIYKVSNTIIYSGAPRACPQTNGCTGEESTKVRFRGQSQTGVIIKLANNASGFQGDSGKSVLSFGKFEDGRLSNQVGSNYVENLTVDIGSGNSGAVGIRFHAANTAAIRNVTIKSSDSNKVGMRGLYLPYNDAHGLVKNLTVDGFNTGIEAPFGRDSSMTFENITLRKQRVAGFRIGDQPVSVRKLKSENTVPAVQITGDWGHAVIIDSQLVGGSPNLDAIDVQKGVLFARNVTVSGYRSAIRRKGSIVQSSSFVNEYVSEPVKTLFSQQTQKSLSLAIEETPNIQWEDNLTQWVSVNSYGAVGDGSADDTTAIRQAMNSGRPVIYFKPGIYRVSGTITIPSSVRRVNFMYARLKAASPLKDSEEGAFRIANSSDPLVLEDLFNWVDFNGSHSLIDHASPRTLVLNDLHSQRGSMYRNSVEGGRVFIENCSSRVDLGDAANFHFVKQKVWARWLNPEYGYPNVLNDGGSLWVLGYKTEPNGTAFETKNGGSTEILGGCSSNYSPYVPSNRPAILNNKSKVSAIFHTSGRSQCDSNGCKFFKTLVTEIRQGDTESLTLEETLNRKDAQHAFVSLYVGTGSNVPETPGEGSKLNIVATTASATQVPNVAANTLDNNLSTRWAAQGDGEWIEYDLGSIKTVSRTRIAWYSGDTRTSNFEIQVSSDGTIWANVYSATSSGTTLQPEEYDFADIAGRYVRIVGRGNSDNDWNSITEIGLYGQ